MDDFQRPLTLVDRAERLNPIRPMGPGCPEGSLDATLIGEMCEGPRQPGSGQRVK
jgi:hypothetical protein